MTDGLKQFVRVRACDRGRMTPSVQEGIAALGDEPIDLSLEEIKRKIRRGI